MLESGPFGSVRGRPVTGVPTAILGRQPPVDAPRSDSQLTIPRGPEPGRPVTMGTTLVDRCGRALLG